MRAMVLTGRRRIEVREVPEVRLTRADAVRLRVDVVGICGSDIHYFTQGRIGSQVVQYPFCIGHEFAATVVEVGDDVRALRPGDRVAVDPAMPCGACDQCRGGREHTCRALRFLGCPGQAEGCLAEFLVMPASCCVPLPTGLSLEAGALVEPLAVAVHAVRLAGPLGGARVGVLGCGPIGLCVLQVARAAGAMAVYATDRIDARVAAARRAGAEWAGNPDREDIVAGVGEQAPLLLDVVFECCGRQEALDQAVALLQPGGRLLVVGIPEVDRVSFAIDSLRRQELCIQNVRRQNGCMRDALALLEQGQVSPEALITHRFPLAQTKEAFDLVAAYGDGVIKAMIQLHE